jgi:hypothetical protein
VPSRDLFFQPVGVIRANAKLEAFESHLTVLPLLVSVQIDKLDRRAAYLMHLTKVLFKPKATAMELVSVVGFAPLHETEPVWPAIHTDLEGDAALVVQGCNDCPGKPDPDICIAVCHLMQERVLEPIHFSGFGS